MKTQYHAVLSLPILLAVAPSAATFPLWFFVANVIVDADHVLNFWIARRQVSFDLPWIYRLYVDRPDAYWSMGAYYPCHAFELVIAIAAVSWVLGDIGVGVAIASGLLFHLFIDVLSLTPMFYPGDHRRAFLYYWLIHRGLNRFRTSALFALP